jgi:hypothetical protein
MSTRSVIQKAIRDEHGRVVELIWTDAATGERLMGDIEGVRDIERDAIGDVVSVGAVHWTIKGEHI